MIKYYIWFNKIGIILGIVIIYIILNNNQIYQASLSDERQGSILDDGDQAL